MAQAVDQQPYVPPLALTHQQRAMLGLRYDREGQPYLSQRATATALDCSYAYIGKVERRTLARLDALAWAVAAGRPLPDEQPPTGGSSRPCGAAGARGARAAPEQCLLRRPRADDPQPHAAGAPAAIRPRPEEKAPGPS